MRFPMLLVLALVPGEARAETPQKCLAEAIYFEAGSRGPTARAAVGHTILNRVAHPEFPNSICEVIAQGEDEDACQFSYRCDGKPETYRYAGQLRRAQAAARRLLDGATEDPTGGALFFHSQRIKPGWFATRERTGTFGGNIFYR